MKLAIPVKYWGKNVLKQFKENVSEKNMRNTTMSQTSKCNEYTFAKASSDLVFHFIDTPGFNDTDACNDQSNLNKIFRACKDYTHINAIILVLNGSDTRLTTSIRAVIENFNSFLPNDLTSSLIVILTNCDELSCNLNLDSFNIKYKCAFFMQNSLLKWSRKETIDLDSRRYNLLKVKKIGRLLGSSLKKFIFEIERLGSIDSDN